MSCGDVYGDYREILESQETEQLLNTVITEEARNVLWYFGDRELGWEPGSFYTKLIQAIGAADEFNRARLYQGFPSLVNATVLAQNYAGGMDMLRELVHAREYVERHGKL